jgi:hypothetical protein
MHIGRVAVAIAISGIVTFVPAKMVNSTSSSGLIASLIHLGAYLAIPGSFLGLIVSRGHIDDVNFVVVDIASFVFYSVLCYFLLSFLSHRIGLRRTPRAM